MPFKYTVIVAKLCRWVDHLPNADDDAENWLESFQMCEMLFVYFFHISVTHLNHISQYSLKYLNPNDTDEFNCGHFGIKISTFSVFYRSLIILPIGV